MFRLGTAAAAFQGSPLWNFTPSRSMKRQVSGSTCSQPVVALVGTIRRSSPDCQVNGSYRLARVTVAFNDAPIEPRELSWMGSSGNTMVMASRAEVTPSGTGVAVGAGVGVAYGIGVTVGANCSAAEGAVVASDGSDGAAAPPQATITTAISAAKTRKLVVSQL